MREYPYYSENITWLLGSESYDLINSMLNTLIQKLFLLPFSKIGGQIVLNLDTQKDVS